MAKILNKEYENPDYPVDVRFIERSPQESGKSEWICFPNDAELVVVNNGELVITTKTGELSVIAGQGLLINANVSHRVSSSKTEGTAFYSVLFSPSYLMDVSSENTLAQKYLAPLKNTSDMQCMILDEANLRDEDAIDKINSIIVANTLKKHGYEILTKAYLCLLWFSLIERITMKDPTFNGRNVPSQDELRVNSAIQYMQESYADYITLEDIASRIHVSRNECCRCFKRVLNVSPVDYLIKYRIFEAARILYKNPLSVNTFSELAFSVGFNNTSYFNKCFRKYFNCTPSEFVKMMKENPDNVSKLYDEMQQNVLGL